MDSICSDIQSFFWFLDRIKEIWYNQNVTTTYTYGDTQWGDLLTQIDQNTITYDAIGNPLKKGFLMNATEFEFGYEYFWDGRELKSIKYFDYYDSNYYLSSIDFTYNADGIRTSKTVYGVEHKYYLNGSQILAETWTQNGVEYLLVFVYDETGSPMAMKYRTSEFAKDSYHYFFYEKNLQGDIVGIYNSNGVKIGTYNYDAWGAHTPTVTSGVTSLESLIVRTYNPFRYRGYYYDTETSLYYLQSRYYDPAMTRFINADGIIGTGGLIGYNMFAYCANNPVMYADHSGYFWDTVFDIISLAASVIEVCINPTDAWAWAGLAGDAVDIIPFVTGVGETTRAVKAGRRAVDAVDDFVDAADDFVDAADDFVDAVRTVETLEDVGDGIHDSAKTVKVIHGNSLKTTKETIGYALRKNDTGEIMKFGETTRGTKRYTKKFYLENNVYMDPITRGSKYDMHLWQHDQILDYTRRNGVRPPWNKSNW